MVKVFVELFISLCVLWGGALAADTRDSYNVQVSHKAPKDQKTPLVSVKAHRFEDLLEFLDLDMNESNFTAISSELSSIPHKITVDVASSTTDSMKWTRDYLPSTGCLDYAPTYLFSFDRDDIKHEFGSEYFLLLPTEGSSGVYKSMTDSSSSSTTNSKQWLHVPKTSSSFELTATNLGYKDVTHDPCPPGSQCELIALFREPYQRLISWFYYSPPVFEKCQINKLKDVSETVYKSALQTCFNDFLRESIYGGAHKTSETSSMFWGCEAKMAIGYHCDETSLPAQYYIEGDKLIKDALSNMRNENIFKFIGNTDFYDASVILSHQMLGSEFEVLDELRKVNTRAQNVDMRISSGNSKLDDIQFDSDFLCENNALCKNLPDEALYAETKRLMMMNVLKHHNNPLRITALPHFMVTNPVTKAKAITDEKCASLSNVQRLRNVNKFYF
jgi:hypothetical protein